MTPLVWFTWALIVMVVGIGLWVRFTHRKAQK